MEKYTSRLVRINGDGGRHSACSILGLFYLAILHFTIMYKNLPLLVWQRN
jgi:hypothetical protein